MSNKSFKRLEDWPLFKLLPLPVRMRLHSPRWLVGTALFVLLLLALSSRWRREEEPLPPYNGPRVAMNAAGEHGFLPLNIAQEFCERRRWEPYAARDLRRKVYDMFLINTELDWLEIRLNELHSEVDYFIILEAAITFQGGEKPLHLQDSFGHPRFEKFRSKIIHQNVDFSIAKKLDYDDTWELERFTRNALFNQALLSLVGPEAPSQGDVLLIGDIDELPRTSTLVALRNCAFPPRVTLRSHFYYYSFQWLHRGDQWMHPQATYYNGPKDTISPEELRFSFKKGKANVDLYCAAWHCSSCFPTMEDLKNKITSFSHKGYNQPYFLETDRLLQNVRMGRDMFERERDVFDRVDDNPDVPAFLLRNESRAKYAYLLDRDPSNANFQDL